MQVRGQGEAEGPRVEAGPEEDDLFETIDRCAEDVIEEPGPDREELVLPACRAL